MISFYYKLRDQSVLCVLTNYFIQNRTRIPEWELNWRRGVTELKIIASPFLAWVPLIGWLPMLEIIATIIFSKVGNNRLSHSSFGLLDWVMNKVGNNHLFFLAWVLLIGIGNNREKNWTKLEIIVSPFLPRVSLIGWWANPSSIWRRCAQILLRFF